MKTTIGLTTRIVIFGRKGKKEVVARVDTGATKSSIDSALAKELDLGPEFKHAKVKSAHGVRYRPVVTAEILIAGQAIESEFTLAEREHMKYQVLIGQNILKKGFLIDPSKG
ncbi:Putative ATP-dependant zinc protease [uncultured archaeon]|nr:Putative ATP-dependant zinc protease [uncultured archaeon]